MKIMECVAVIAMVLVTAFWVYTAWHVATKGLT